MILFFCFVNNALSEWVPCNNGISGGSTLRFKYYNDTAYTITGNKPYYTTNDGLNWIMFDTPDSLKTRDMIITQKGIFLGTETGIFKSSDGGLTWQDIECEFSNIYVMEFINDRIYVGSSIGMHISEDFGENWFYNDLSGMGVVRTITGKDSVVYAGLDNKGLYKTTDNGYAWKSIKGSLKTEYVVNITLDGNRVYVLLSVGIMFEFNYGLYYTEDDGANWIQIPTPKDFRSYSTMFLSENIILLGISYNGLHRSTDNGATWAKVSNGFTSVYPYYLKLYGNKLFAATSSGIYMSMDNGYSWERRSNGLKCFSIRSIVERDNTIFIGSQNDGVYKSTDFGNSWVSVNNNLQCLNISYLSVQGDNLYAGAFAGGTFMSTDNGANWQQMHQDNADSTFLNYVYSLYSHENTFYVGGSSGINSTSDGGQTWKFLDPDTSKSNYYVKAMIIHDGVFYAGTSLGLFVSSDNGDSWNLKLSSQARDFTVWQDKVFAATNGGVFYTSDNGENWTQANTGNIQSFFSAASHENLVIAGDIEDGYVIFSSDGGNSWFFSNNFGADNYIYDLAVIGEYIFAGIGEKGIYKTLFEGFETTGIQDESDAESKLDLVAYPAPASDVVNISITNVDYELNINDVLIYDIYGRLINTSGKITLENLPPNSTKISWSCSDVPNGIYSVNFSSGNFRNQATVVILR